MSNPAIRNAIRTYMKDQVKDEKWLDGLAACVLSAAAKSNTGETERTMEEHIQEVQRLQEFALSEACGPSYDVAKGIAHTYETSIEAAKRLCEIYFNIAVEVIGEDEVRLRRDRIIKEINNGNTV